MILKVLLIVFMGFFSYVYSAPNNVSEVPCSSSIMTIEAADVANKTTIFLNNGTVWTCKYKDLFDGPYGWCIGDRIHIVYVYSEGYYLQNASCQGCIPVKLQNANAEDLQVNTIKEIIKNDKKSTNTIVLNDETRWFIGSWSSAWMKNWQVGNRIIVTAQEFIFGNADHLLLNLDQGNSVPENVRGQLLYSPKTIQFEDLNKRETRDWKISIVCTWHEEDAFIIELDNKTLWQCSHPKLDWQIGDNLEFDLNDKECKLINLRNSEKIHATIMNRYSEEMDLPIIQEISRNGTKIVLSDGSAWFLGSAYKKWRKGDRIIASSLRNISIDTTTHTLINIDKSTESVQEYRSATLIK